MVHTLLKCAIVTSLTSRRLFPKRVNANNSPKECKTVCRKECLKKKRVFEDWGEDEVPSEKRGPAGGVYKQCRKRSGRL